MRISSPTLIDLLSSTLRRLEDTPELDPHDPILVEFKRAITRSIAELELRRADAA